MKQSTFTFQSHGSDVVGTLLKPATSPKGLVITTGPLTSVKEQAAGVYAKAMCALGYVALAFDHRYFGESGGQPRQLENPHAKVEDIHAALTALQGLPDFRDLKVLGFGVCAGGGYMAAAVAADRRFAAFAGVAGVYSDPEQTKAWMGANYAAAKVRAQVAFDRYLETGVAETIPAVAKDLGDVAMPLLEAYEYYGTPRGQVPNYVNGFAVQSRLYTLDFDVQSIAAGISAPALVVHSQNALAPALARSFFEKLPGQKRDIWLQSVGQIDFYDDVRLIDEATRHIDSFFQTV